MTRNRPKNDERQESSRGRKAHRSMAGKALLSGALDCRRKKVALEIWGQERRGKNKSHNSRNPANTLPMQNQRPHSGKQKKKGGASAEILRAKSRMEKTGGQHAHGTVKGQFRSELGEWYEQG